MHWILQDNLFNEAAYQVLRETLERFGISHSVHKVIPFVGELVDDVPVNHQNIICMGSYSLRHLAKRNGWNPGVFDLEPYDFTVQLKHWSSHMLNADAKVVKFMDIDFGQHEELFLRPIEDSKVFSGGVFTKEDTYDWIHKVVNLGENYGNSLTKNTLVQVCSLKPIYVEARFWVIQGKIITASIYKRGSRVIYTDDVPECYFDYVRDRIDEWQPHEAFVIDVADTPDGMKIVEINTINSAGFYAANIPKLVAAFEEAFNDPAH
mgnify:CR=1 FL=1